jgi:hypothetical protein
MSSPPEGFATGEGCFYILARKGRNIVGVGFTLVFQVSQHLRDAEILMSLVDYFSCGRYVQHKSTE